MAYSRENRRTIERFVARRITVLQNQYLKDIPFARAQLARLRRAATTNPGAVAETWDFEFGDLPEQLGGKGEESATPGEWSSHLSFTLYAIHQQSKNQEMFCQTNSQEGEFHGLGNAMRLFVEFSRKDNRGEQLEQGEMPRRFASLVTAESIEEVAHYARQLVQQLRDTGIALDYGRLAGQLYAFQYGELRDGVRLEWAREYSQWRPAKNDLPANTDKRM